jgi:hypothetical protein
VRKWAAANDFCSRHQMAAAAAVAHRDWGSAAAARNRRGWGCGDASCRDSAYAAVEHRRRRDCNKAAEATGGSYSRDWETGDSICTCIKHLTQTWGDNFSPRMPCQWHMRGGGEGTEMESSGTVTVSRAVFTNWRSNRPVDDGVSELNWLFLGTISLPVLGPRIGFFQNRSE